MRPTDWGRSGLLLSDPLLIDRGSLDGASHAWRLGSDPHREAPIIVSIPVGAKGANRHRHEDGICEEGQEKGRKEQIRRHQWGRSERVLGASESTGDRLIGTTASFEAGAPARRRRAPVRRRPDQLIRAKSAAPRFTNLPCPFRPVNSPFRTMTEPRLKTMSDRPRTVRPS